MTFKKIELYDLHPANPLVEVISDINENFDILHDSLQNITSSQGVQGEQGIQGEQGPAGQDGKDGLPGVNGKDGAQGIQGIRGEQGIQGIQGPAGKDGAKGETGPVGVPGAMNYKVYAPGRVTGVNAIGKTILSTTFTSTGNPVMIIVTGDANPTSGGGYIVLQLARNGSSIGMKVQAEQTSANINVPYCVQVVDTPPAGTYTYSMQTVTAVGGTWDFGEQDGPTMTILELTGATGPQGAGVGSTVVQNSITLGATANAPSVATRTVQRIESQVIGDKVRLTYKLGQLSAAPGSGEYLLTLPTGMTFNQTYNPVYNGGIWAGGVNAMAPYYITAAGGIIIDGSWSNQIMVVPYDSTRFRLALTNNVSQTTYGFWNSGWYATNAASGINLQLSFEIWK